MQKYFKNVLSYIHDASDQQCRQLSLFYYSSKQQLIFKFYVSLAYRDVSKKAIQQFYSIWIQIKLKLNHLENQKVKNQL